MKILLAATLSLMLIGGNCRTADANMFGLPRNLLGVKERIAFDVPTLAPLAFTKFCMRYPEECQPMRTSWRGGLVKLTPERYAILLDVNRQINASIRPQRNEGGIMTEEWLIDPAAGDCNDYAVSKKHRLRALGWPPRSLFLSEVITSWGEHHLVLVVRTDKGDLVLDNLAGSVRPLEQARYRLVRAQKPNNPMAWFEILRRGNIVSASREAASQKS